MSSKAVTMQSSKSFHLEYFFVVNPFQKLKLWNQFEIFTLNLIKK